MTTAAILDQFARDVANVIPQLDATAEHHRWQPGIGAFDEKEQVRRLAERLGQQSTYYEVTETEVLYPNSGQRCDIIIGSDGSQIPVEAKLLRFYRDNGEYLTLQPLESRRHQSSGQEPTHGSVGS